jgi:hypothetical protein
MQNSIKLLAVGDIAAIAVVTVIGFASHGELGSNALLRMPSTLVPLMVAWFLAAPFVGLFNPEVSAQPRQLWRPLAVMLFAGPLAALLRAFWLNTTVIPIFGLVLSVSTGIALLIWRALWCWRLRSIETKHQ